MLELILRLIAFRLEYLRSPANWLDILVVVSSAPEVPSVAKINEKNKIEMKNENEK